MTWTFDAARWLPRAALFCLAAGVPVTGAQDAATLQARYTELRESLAHNDFQRPLHLESSEKSATLTGVVHARVPQSYAVAGPALSEITHWCDILILHPNIKGCRTAGATLRLSVGRNTGQEPADASQLEFAYAVVASEAGYVRVLLTAPAGPFGTTHYRIVLEVARLEDERSFVRLSYAYRHGAAAGWALRAYLATLGRAKVGFSIVDRKPDGGPVYIGSTRGMVERNAMRCYLAIEAFLDALKAPAGEQVERRLQHWHAGARQYSVQLREAGLDEYLDMKRSEIRRQQALMSPGAQTSLRAGATLGEASAPAANTAAPTPGSSP